MLCMPVDAPFKVLEHVRVTDALYATIASRCVWKFCSWGVRDSMAMHETASRRWARQADCSSRTERTPDPDTDRGENQYQLWL